MQITTLELWMDWTWNFPCDGRSAVCDVFFSCSDQLLYSTIEDSTNDKCCWKVWIHSNLYSRLAQEPWIESPRILRRSLPEIVSDGCRNQNYISQDLDGRSQVS
ncbi:hypothetical protein AVEN_215057-1 [Araneus ventricosus]|uniref:Uncharacterized protein n=1 Tax=Araneus ventricosus TaxID=182803 RepID=A0A4Y2Q704_ARAVE|nr:hypothetical protein AVEN_215057-1 [Araneus ventricosus]